MSGDQPLDKNQLKEGSVKRDMDHHVGEGRAPERKEGWSHFVLRK